MIADAVFARPSIAKRSRLARKAGGSCSIGLRIDAPLDLLAGRLRERVTDASDATVDVLDGQARADIGSLDWHRLDGSCDAENVQQSAQRALRESSVPSFSFPSRDARRRSS